MDEKRGPIVAGFGGAALVAALMSIGGPSSPPSAGPQASKTPIAASASSHPDITSNQDGPWYAFCQEYATTEFDHGEDPSQERGIKGHRVPEEAEEGTVEITHQIKGKNGPETEKFNVRKHMVGELSSCVPPGEKLRVAIALVPDPNATQMRLDFDRDIAAIQGAAAAEHYNYTRYWFPWRPNDWTPDKSDDPEAETRRRQEPGILCFRRNNGQGATDRLFVLMVGETPTSGANRIQLAHALYYGEQLTGADRSDVDIAGPHFSASFKSIQDVLVKVKAEHLPDTPHKQPQTANIVAPDASGQEYISEFQQFCSSQKASCRLRTLSLSSDRVKDVTFDFLHSLHYKSRFIAQLSEDQSAFGSSEFNPLRTEPDKESDYGLMLHFPRDLSSVRSLSDEQSAKIVEAGSKYFTLPGNSLPTQLSAHEPIDRDTPAAFGSEQEAAEVARSLAASVEEMRIHRIRAVVISASNPLDRIYLLEYLHNQLPDVRVVTIDADTLELDRPHFIDLTGTIAVTALPTLTGMTDIIEHPGSKTRTSPPISFESSRQESEFLAVETLLNGTLELSSSLAAQECFYFTVVSGNGFRLMPQSGRGSGALRFPCSVSQSFDKPDTRSPLTGVPREYLTTHEHTSAPSAFLTFLGALLLLNVMHLWCVISSRRGIEGMFSYPSPLTPSREPTRFCLLFLVNNQLLLLNLLAAKLACASLYAIDNRHYSDGLLVTLFWLIAPITAITIFLSAFFSFQFVRSLKHPEIEKGTNAPRVIQMAIATLFLFCTVWMVFSLPVLQSGHSIFLERITHLGEGLSPVLPITAILIGYFLWGWTQLRRLDWSASRKPHLTFTPSSSECLHSRVTSLQTCLEDPSPTQSRAQIICVVLALVAAVALRDSLNGFDGFGFYLWFVVWGVFMLLLTVTMTCFHAWCTWDRLRKLLDWLEATSMGETYKRLGDEGVLKIKIWDLAKTQKSFKILRSTVESIERIKGQDSLEAKEAHSQLGILLSADANHRQLPPGQIELLSQKLNALMDPAVQSLTKPATTSDTNNDELQVYLAFRIVALIRYAMLHMGAMIGFVAYGFVLAVFSVMFYAFEGRKTIGELLVLILVALLIWIGTMMVQFQRNTMLSRVEGSVPGQVNYGEVMAHLLTIGGLPLVAILTSQFPSIANFAYSFFRPLLSALH